MIEFVTGKEMSLLDKNTIEKFYIPQLVLMERAALALRDNVLSQGRAFSNCLIVCGNGNNGGDGVALSRLLNEAGLYTAIYLVNQEECDYSSGLKEQLKIYRAFGYPEVKILEDTYDLIVDGIFGVGLSREITGEYKRIIKCINDMHGYKLAIDIPSGISADTGKMLGCAFNADETVTFAFDKVGFHIWPGFEYAGKVQIAKIGIIKEAALTDVMINTFALEDVDIRKWLPKRKIHSNKGSYGKVLIIAGSKGMSGACYLCAKTAYRAGSGIVTVLTPDENRLIIQKMLPEALVKTYTDEINETLITEEIKRADAIVIGPGIGLTSLSQELLSVVINNHMEKPLVFDADALNILSENKELLEKAFLCKAIFTPHLGEAARLMKCSVVDIQENFVNVAKEYAISHGISLVLKDCNTITAMADGKAYINLSGNNGMATGGSGDVLAGLMGALLAQGASFEYAACLAVYLHGRGGDIAADKLGVRSMMAEDIINGISQFLQEIDSLT